MFKPYNSGDFFSFDLGGKYTGVSYFSGGEHIETKTLLCNHNVDSTKSVIAFSLIKEYLLSKTYLSDIVIIYEDYGYGGGFFNVGQAEIVGQLKRFSETHKELIECLVPLAPNTVKKAVTGNGKAKKAEIIKEITQLGYNVENSHEADSIALFLAYKLLWSTPTESLINRAIFTRKDF